MEKTSKQKITQQVILFVLVFLLAFFGTKYLFSGKSSPEKILKTTSEEINKKCPMKVDDETRMDNCEVKDKNTLQYNYTILSQNKDSLTVNINYVKEFVKKKAQNNLDTSPKMQDFRNNNIVLAYYYKDKNGKYLFDFTVKSKKK